MTNEQTRRGSGAANEAARRAGDGAAARRASGDAMVERRTGQSQVADINAVVNQPRPRKQLKPVAPRGALPAQTSPGTNTPNPAKTSGGGGIASPLTEQTRIEEGVVVPDRAFYAERAFPTSDGIFTMLLKPIKATKFLDANGAEEVRQWAEPK